MAKKTINVVYKVDDGELRKVKTTIQGAEKETEKLNNELKKTGDQAKRAGADASKSFLDFKNIVASIGIAGLAYTIGNLAKKVFDLGVAQEQTNIAFSTFLGSADKAKKVIADLNKFAIITPFTPAQVNKAAQTLLAFGVQADELIPTLKFLGDVSSGTGKDLSEMAVIFGQIRSTGRLMGQDLLQLINAGFNPLQQISKTTGRSVAQLKKDMEDGLITFDMVRQAFIEVTSEGGLFFNLMEKQSESIGGKLSTIEGNIEEIGKKLFETKKSGLSEFTGGVADLTSNVDLLSKALDTIISQVTAGPTVVLNFFNGIAESAKEAARETERLKREELELQLALVEAELQSFRTTRSHEEKVKLIQRMVELRNQLGLRMPTTEDPLPWVTDDKKDNAVGLIEAIEAKIKTLREEIRKTTSTGDLGANGLLVKQLKEAQEELDRLLGKEKQGENEAEKLRKQALENTRKYLKSRYENRMKNAEETAKREAENNKRSFEHWKYYQDLKVKKQQETEQEAFAIAEDNARRRQRLEEEIYQGAEALAFALFDFALTKREEDIEGIRSYYDEQIELAGDNERARKELELKRERDLEAARQRQKEAEKDAAVKRILIDGLVAIGKIFGEFGWPAGIIPAAIMAGITAVNVAQVKKYKDGGWIEGPGTGTSDSVPIMASNGEFMVRQSAANKAPKLLELINDRKLDDRILRSASGGSQFTDANIVNRLLAIEGELKRNKPDDVVERHKRLMRATKRSKDYVMYVRANVMGDF